MPLYEYECFLCGHRFERIQKASDPLLDQCPDCGGAVRRLLGVPALQFKGSGWYVTDYGKGNGGRAAVGTKGEESATTPPKKATTATKKAPAKSKN